MHFHDYLDAAGRRYHAPTATPTIPAPLRPYVTDVVGLSTRAIATPADLPHGTLRPQDAALAYDVAPLLSAGITGQGQTIAIVSLEPFPPNVSQTSGDVKTFRSQLGIDGPFPVDVKVDGGGKSKDETEDDLDLDVTSSIAPGAQIVNYEAPETASGLVDVFNRVIADGKAKIVAFSWGLCDSGLSADFRNSLENVLRLADRRGITVFSASGDSGAYDCQRDSFSNHSLSVDFPSDSPQVVSVGGTLLNVQSDGSYGYETGWENPLTDGGGGGGTNMHDPAPSWQTAAHIGDGHRVCPTSPPAPARRAAGSSVTTATGTRSAARALPRRSGPPRCSSPSSTPPRRASRRRASWPRCSTAWRSTPSRTRRSMT